MLSRRVHVLIWNQLLPLILHEALSQDEDLAHASYIWRMLAKGPYFCGFDACYLGVTTF